MRADGVAAWDQHAAWWQDTFTAGADPEYEEQILPMARAELYGARRVLDVGTGEGQVARAACGGLVVGVDPSRAQVVEAVARGGGVRYLLACADGLPFAGEAFDVVVVCLVLEHVAGYAEAIAEIARVLEPRGRFLLFLNHPLLQTPGSGWIDDHILDEQYWRIGPYLVDELSVEEVAPGVGLPFAHRPLSRYVNVMAEHGLFIDRMEEPSPPPGFLTRAPEYEAASTIPRLLFVRATKRGAASRP